MYVVDEGGTGVTLLSEQLYVQAGSVRVEVGN